MSWGRLSEYSYALFRFHLCQKVFVWDVKSCSAMRHTGCVLLVSQNVRQLPQKCTSISYRHLNLARW